MSATVGGRCQTVVTRQGKELKDPTTGELVRCLTVLVLRPFRNKLMQLDQALLCPSCDRVDLMPSNGTV